MTTHDLSTLPPPQAAAQLAELEGYLGSTLSRPAVLRPEGVNKRSIARVAMAAATGVKINGRRYEVIGSPDWQGDDPPDLTGLPAELPLSISLHSDMRGHTELFRGYRIGFRQCAACEDDFEVRRPARNKARWPETCSDACRREWKRQRERATYSVRKG